jgi:hypothetical protein
MIASIKIRTLLPLAFFSIVICMPACRKGFTIWGTWGESSLTRVYRTNGSVTYTDTTYYDTTGSGPVFTFTTIGTYFSTYSNGKYTLNNNTLTLLDTANTPNITTTFAVLTLNHNILVLGHGDTISPGPLSMVQYIYTCVPR